MLINSLTLLYNYSGYLLISDTTVDRQNIAFAKELSANRQCNVKYNKSFMQILL